MHFLMLFLAFVFFVSANLESRCHQHDTQTDDLRKIGLEYLQNGRANFAETCFRILLSRVANVPSVRVMLSEALEAQGNVTGSMAELDAVLREYPNDVLGNYRYGVVQRIKGEYSIAEKHLRKAISLAPAYASAYMQLGLTLRGKNDNKGALQCYAAALKLEPNRSDVWVNQGVAQLNMGLIDQAQRSYEAAIEHNPKLHQAYFNLGVIHQEHRKNAADALQAYHTALSIQPRFADAYNTIGTLQTSLGYYDQSKAALLMAIQLAPGDGRFYNSLGIAHEAAGDLSAAVKVLEEGILVAPHIPALYLNLAKIYNTLGNRKQAEQLCLKSLEMDPTAGRSYCQLADVYKDSGDIAAALQNYQKCVDLSPDFDAGWCNRLYALLFASKSADVHASLDRVRMAVDKTLKAGDPFAHECVQPFQSLAYPLENKELLEIARFHAEKAAARSRALLLEHSNLDFVKHLSHPVVTLSKQGRKTTTLRIGFASGDYGDHPVIKDLIFVFNLMTRMNIQPFCFALNRDEGFPHTFWRDHMATVCSFIDLGSQGDVAAATTINQHRLHILINLHGYTFRERNEVFALKPAPVQIAYKGFVGTHGSSYLPYMISDRILSPPELSIDLSEHLIFMPDTYVVNSYAQANQHMFVHPADVADPLPANAPPITRKGYGLDTNTTTDEAFIMGCFNQQYKVDATVLQTWAAIMNACPSATLWMLRFPSSQAAEANIKAHLSKLGVASSRVVFTELMHPTIHLQVKGLADIFVDTPAYNGHGTATDALWAGLPVITSPQYKLSSRAAASYAQATGLGSLTIARNMEDYQQLVVALASLKNRKWLAKQKEKALMERDEWPVFDGKRWVEYFKTAMKMLWEASTTNEGNPKHVIVYKKK